MKLGMTRLYQYATPSFGMTKKSPFSGDLMQEGLIDLANFAR